MQITEHIHALKIPFLVPVGPEKELQRFVCVYLISGYRIGALFFGIFVSFVLSLFTLRLSMTTISLQS
jgi:hypothetical protein